MIAYGSSLLARGTRHERVLENGFRFHRSEWMQGGEGPGLAPTIFLVEQPAHSVLAPHFHLHNQFQVVKDGSGMLGRHAVGPGSVHYAGAFTGYGPLVAGPQGLSYFTIRAACETGATFLPVERDQIRRGPRRHAQGPVHPPLSLGALRKLGCACRVQLLARQDDLEAYALQLPAGASVAPLQPEGSGQFQIVLSGTMTVPRGSLQAWESRFLSPGEDGAGCTAGPEGLHLLVLQLPAHPAQYVV